MVVGVSTVTLARLDLPGGELTQDVTLSDTLLGTLTLSPLMTSSQVTQRGSLTRNENAPMPTLCVTSCKHKHKSSKKSMIQCHLCQIWCHYDCIGEKEKDIIGIWCCITCRQLSRTIQSMHVSMANLDTTVQLLQENNARLVEHINAQILETKRLRDENDALKEQVQRFRSDKHSEALMVLSDKINCNLGHDCKRSSRYFNSNTLMVNKDHNKVVSRFNAWLKDKCMSSNVNYIDKWYYLTKQ